MIDWLIDGWYEWVFHSKQTNSGRNSLSIWCQSKMSMRLWSIKFFSYYIYTIGFFLFLFFFCIWFESNRIQMSDLIIERARSYRRNHHSSLWFSIDLIVLDSGFLTMKTATFCCRFEFDIFRSISAQHSNIHLELNWWEEIDRKEKRAKLIIE